MLKNKGSNRTKGDPHPIYVHELAGRHAQVADPKPSRFLGIALQHHDAAQRFGTVPVGQHHPGAYSYFIIFAGHDLSVSRGRSASYKGVESAQVLRHVSTESLGLRQT